MDIEKENGEKGWIKDKLVTLCIMSTYSTMNDQEIADTLNQIFGSSLSKAAVSSRKSILRGKIPPSYSEEYKKKLLVCNKELAEIGFSVPEPITTNQFSHLEEDSIVVLLERVKVLEEQNNNLKTILGKVKVEVV